MSCVLNCRRPLHVFEIEQLCGLQEELPSSQAIHYPPNLKVALFHHSLWTYKSYSHSYSITSNWFLVEIFFPPPFLLTLFYRLTSSRMIYIAPTLQVDFYLSYFTDWLLPSLLHWLLLHAHTSNCKECFIIISFIKRIIIIVIKRHHHFTETAKTIPYILHLLFFDM